MQTPGAHTMRRLHHNGNRWAGALLVAVQFVALVLLPVLHRPAPVEAAPAVDAPGSPVDGHSEATCLLCRVAGVRFVPPSTSSPLAAGRLTAGGARPTGSSEYRTVRLLTSIAARAPPITV